MDNNNTFGSDFANGTNTQEPNQININQNGANNLEKKEKNTEEKEENDNLGYLPGINHTKFNNFNQKQRLDSTDSPMAAQFKFSIDMPNVSKQRLNEYLNEDLLNALEESPNIPNLNSDLQNNKSEKTDPENDPNNLFGFSLYPSSPQDIDNNYRNLNNNNMNYMQESNFYPNKNYNQGDNQNNIYTNNFQNVYNNNINFNNYNYNINFPEMQNNNNINIALNNNPPIFVPKQLRNNDYIQKNNVIMNEKIDNFNFNNDKLNQKNKFDNNKRNMQNSKKEGKMKKHFEVRVGDWTCSKCANLNFSFRNKCNRCGIPKELSEKIHSELLKQEMMRQNSNFNFPNNGNYQ